MNRERLKKFGIRLGIASIVLIIIVIGLYFLIIKPIQNGLFDLKRDDNFDEIDLQAIMNLPLPEDAENIYAESWSNMFNREVFLRMKVTPTSGQTFLMQLCENYPYKPNFVPDDMLERQAIFWWTPEIMEKGGGGTCSRGSDDYYFTVDQTDPREFVIYLMILTSAP